MFGVIEWKAATAAAFWTRATINGPSALVARAPFSRHRRPAVSRLPLPASCRVPCLLPRDRADPSPALAHVSFVLPALPTRHIVKRKAVWAACVYIYIRNNPEGTTKRSSSSAGGGDDSAGGLYDAIREGEYVIIIIIIFMQYYTALIRYPTLLDRPSSLNDYIII